jgi:type IV secretory pathway component VirB8
MVPAGIGDAGRMQHGRQAAAACQQQRSDVAAATRPSSIRGASEVSDEPRINPWQAKPLTEKTKEAKFRKVMDAAVERAMVGKAAIITGWVLSSAGVGLLAVSVWGWYSFLPFKTVVPEFWLVDKSTGIIAKPVGISDAPSLFGAFVEQHYLRLYLEARENWVPEMDQRADHVVKIMSTPDEQARYMAFRRAPQSPMVEVGKDGHVEIERVRYLPQAMDKVSGTRRYLLLFDRTIWHEATKGPTVPWSATVDFQWHPELPMSPDDRTDNPGGFQAINYSRSSDSPDQKRQ